MAHLSALPAGATSDGPPLNVRTQHGTGPKGYLRRHNQHHGVVVDKEGIIVDVDEDRADPRYRIGAKYRTQD